MSARVVLCYGDSNTHGTPPMEDRLTIGRLGPEERWPGVLAGQLGAGWRVIEEGLGGRTTVHPDPLAAANRNGIETLPVALESHRPIDVVALMLGTNDLKQRLNLPAVEIATGVERLVLTILQSACGPQAGAPRILLVCPPPVEEAGCLAGIFAGGAAKSRRLPPLYAEVAARHGAAFLDAGDSVTSSPLDGVHFDAENHARLGHAVAAALRDLAF